MERLEPTDLAGRIRLVLVGWVEADSLVELAGQRVEAELVFELLGVELGAAEVLVSVLVEAQELV